jgi:hypothetical protein
MGKGKTNNPNGRPKGTPNKVTGEVRTWLAGLIDKNRKQIERDLKQLKPKDRLYILEKLMQYTVPKQQAVTAQISIDSLTDSQLDTIISEITANIQADENSDQ